MARYAYWVTDGRAHDLRWVDDAYVLQPGELEGEGDTLPDIEDLSTVPMETTLPTTEFIARWTNAEYLALEKKRRDDVANNKVGNAKNWDVVVTDPIIDVKRQKVQTLKADLVTDGVLTQARADEIFG